MTYRHEDYSVYVVDMRLRRFPPFARLVQVLPDGSVKLRAVWITGRNVSAVHLSTGLDRRLLFALSQPGRFRAVQIDPSTPVPGLVSAAQPQDGKLASPLRSSEGGVTAAVRDAQGAVSVHPVERRRPDPVLPAWKPEWCFE